MTNIGLGNIDAPDSNGESLFSLAIAYKHHNSEAMHLQKENPCICEGCCIKVEKQEGNCTAALHKSMTLFESDTSSPVLSSLAFTWRLPKNSFLK